MKQLPWLRRSLCSLLLCGAAAASAASFPCTAAKSEVEKRICSDAALSELDGHLGRYYAAARVALKHADACLVGEQRNWLRSVRDACPDTACLKRAYLDRLAVLHGVQAGASALHHIELPRLPPLMWIVPPAADRVAAPRTRPTRELVARGRIVNEVASGDGWVLQTASAQKHLLIPAMFLEVTDGHALSSLAALRDATYEARGRSDADDRTASGAAFASSQCIFIHRITP